MSLVGEFWDFLKVRKKFWLAPILIGTGDIVGVHNSGGRFTGCGSVHLYALLEGRLKA